MERALLYHERGLDEEKRLSRMVSQFGYEDARPPPRTAATKSRCYGVGYEEAARFLGGQRFAP
jgi:hypothetical protein